MKLFNAIVRETKRLNSYLKDCLPYLAGPLSKQRHCCRILNLDV